MLDMVTVKEFDIVIKNGTVVDGVDHTKSRADIAIPNGEIVSVRTDIAGSAARVLDAKDHIVAPGFIDMHSHSDFIIRITGSADSFVRQGITTTVVGMCGSSLAQIGPLKRDAFLEEIAKFTPQLKDIEIE